MRALIELMKFRNSHAIRVLYQLSRSYEYEVMAERTLYFHLKEAG